MSAGPVSSSNLFAPFLDRLAEAASGAIMPHFRQGFAIDNKWEAGFDPVTIADKNGETAMRALINETYPDHGILGEEHGPENLDAEHVRKQPAVRSCRISARLAIDNKWEAGLTRSPSPTRTVKRQCAP